MSSLRPDRVTSGSSLDERRKSTGVVDIPIDVVVDEVAEETATQTASTLDVLIDELNPFDEFEPLLRNGVNISSDEAIDLAKSVVDIALSLTGPVSWGLKAVKAGAKTAKAVKTATKTVDKALTTDKALKATKAAALSAYKAESARKVSKISRASDRAAKIHRMKKEGTLTSEVLTNPEELKKFLSDPRGYITLLYAEDRKKARAFVNDSKRRVNEMTSNEQKKKQLMKAIQVAQKTLNAIDGIPMGKYEKSKKKAVSAARTLINMYPTSNDPKWYTKNGASGIKANFGSQRISGMQPIAQSKDYHRCDLILETALTVPNGPAFDQAVNQMMVRMRKTAAAWGSYSVADLKEYLLNVRSIYAGACVLKRTVKASELSSPYDPSFASRSMAMSLGVRSYDVAGSSGLAEGEPVVDARSIISEIPEIKAWLRTTLGTLAPLIPKGLSIYERTAFLFSNFFKDTQSAKADYACFVPVDLGYVSQIYAAPLPTSRGPGNGLFVDAITMIKNEGADGSVTYEFGVKAFEVTRPSGVNFVEGDIVSVPLMVLQKSDVDIPGFAGKRSRIWNPVDMNFLAGRSNDGIPPAEALTGLVTALMQKVINNTRFTQLSGDLARAYGTYSPGDLIKGLEGPAPVVYDKYANMQIHNADSLQLYSTNSDKLYHSKKASADVFEINNAPTPVVYPLDPTKPNTYVTQLKYTRWYSGMGMFITTGQNKTGPYNIIVPEYLEMQGGDPLGGDTMSVDNPGFELRPAGYGVNAMIGDRFSQNAATKILKGDRLLDAKTINPSPGEVLEMTRLVVSYFGSEPTETVGAAGHDNAGPAIKNGNAATDAYCANSSASSFRKPWKADTIGTLFNVGTEVVMFMMIVKDVDGSKVQFMNPGAHDSHSLDIINYSVLQRYHNAPKMWDASSASTFPRCHWEIDCTAPIAEDTVASLNNTAVLSLFK